MDNSGIGGLERIRQDAWLQTALKFLRENATTANLVGLIGGVCALLILLAPLPEAWNMRLPFYLVIFVWTILRPRVALYLMPIAVPWGSLDIIAVGGLNLNSADVLVGFLAAGWLMSFALRPARQLGTSMNETGPRDRVAFNSSNVSIYLIWAIIILLGTMLLSMMAAINISSSLKEVSKWLEFLVLVLLGAQYIRTRRQVWTIIVLVCVAGITQAMYGYFQAFFNLGPEAFIRDTSLRVYGTFGQPNPFAGYINLPLSIALALMLLGSNWRTRLLAGLSAILLAGAEYLTQSRGGEIAIAVATLFIVIVGVPHLRKLIALLALAGLGAVEVFFVGWIPEYVLTPLFKYLGLTQISFVNPGSADFSTAERLAHWISGVHMFLNHPLIGVGIGNYPDAYPGYFITIFVNSLGHAHNYYINIAAETGSIGLTAYLLFLMAIFVTGGSAFQAISKNILKNDRALAIGLLAALISVCVHNLVDDLYVHSLTNLLSLLLIVLIRLEGVTTKVGGTGGYFDYKQLAK
ncbi:MAG: O-antigen ligase family protein [Ktedonobacteraceae bacterium]